MPVFSDGGHQEGFHKLVSDLTGFKNLSGLGGSKKNSGKDNIYLTEIA
jgi:hypothetical protein